jgi:hypothetical protein
MAERNGKRRQLAARQDTLECDDSSSLSFLVRRSVRRDEKESGDKSPHSKVPFHGLVLDESREERVRREPRVQPANPTQTTRVSAERVSHPASACRLPLRE